MNEFNKRAIRRSKPLSLSEVKSRYPEYRYAVCNEMSGNPLYLCETLESAQERMETLWDFSGLICYIVDLWYGYGCSSC